MLSTAKSIFRGAVKGAVKAGTTVGTGAVKVGTAIGKGAVSGGRAVGQGTVRGIKTIASNTTGENLFILAISVLPFGLLLLPSGGGEAQDPYGIEEDVGPFLAQALPYVVSTIFWIMCCCCMCMIMMMFAGAEN